MHSGPASKGNKWNDELFDFHTELFREVGLHLPCSQPASRSVGSMPRVNLRNSRDSVCRNTRKGAREMIRLIALRAQIAFVGLSYSPTNNGAGTYRYAIKVWYGDEINWNNIEFFMNWCDDVLGIHLDNTIGVKLCQLCNPERFFLRSSIYRFMVDRYTVHFCGTDDKRSFGFLENRVIWTN